MTREYKLSSRCVRAAKLRAQYDSWISRHVILSRHVLDTGRAVFLVGQPDRSEYRAEIAMLGHGTVFVNGDVDAVVFGICSHKTWQGKLWWLCGTNYGYAEEKASIGSTCSKMARDYDPDIAGADVCDWRRHGYLNREDARAVYDLVHNDEIHDAQNELYRRTGDCELVLGEVTNCRVILAQALITKLCGLLEAEDSARFRGQARAWFGRAA